MLLQHVLTHGGHLQAELRNPHGSKHVVITLAYTVIVVVTENKKLIYNKLNDFHTQRDDLL